jgi:hypothetical protein
MKKAILLVGFFFWPACGCTEETGKTSDEAGKKAEVLREAIRAEIESLDAHPWAGEYYEGDGLGVNVYLSIAPQAGYVFEWHGCLGLYDRNFGAVGVKEGKLHLTFTFPNERKGFQGIAEELIPIAWGDRSYLIPAGDVVGFCNEVNDGSEPRNGLHGYYLLRKGDGAKNVTGLPAVPKEFEPYLLKRPIETEIVGVEKVRSASEKGEVVRADVNVTVRHGKKTGLLPGMKLYVTDPEDLVESIIIKKVEQEKSEGVMSSFGPMKKVPKIGWKLSTRCPWNSENKANNQKETAKHN